MKKYLSISELAKLRNVTTETLRHYDRIGLLKPCYVDPENGRRYYSSDQFEILGTIRELRQLGMSLEDIGEYFKDRNLNKSLDILTRRYEILKKEIQEKILLEKVIKRKLRFINEIKDLKPDREPHLKLLPERYMIGGDKMESDATKTVRLLTELEQRLKDKAPVLASDRMGFYMRGDLFAYEYGKVLPKAPMILCSIDESVQTGAYTEIIPQGEYLCMYYNNSVGTAEMGETEFYQLKNCIQDNHYEICGNIYLQYIVDITLTSRPKEKLIEIQIPVKRSEK